MQHVPVALVPEEGNPLPVKDSSQLSLKLFDQCVCFNLNAGIAIPAVRTTSSV
jgi:hypothetical protein